MGASITVERDVRVAMRDGIHLATDVYRPAAPGRRPVLVYRTPYDKNDWFMAGIVLFTPFQAVERGYVVVIQDCRGRFGSEGEWSPFFCEGADGYDTVEWAAAQPWSNGRIGIYGSSYNGVTVLQALIEAPPHLEAAIAYVTAANYHASWAYAGGAFELAFNRTWALFQGWDALGRTGLSEERRTELLAALARQITDPEPGLRRLPLRDDPLFREIAPYYDEWIAHPCYDDYWRRVDVVARAAEIRAPLLHITCWYDGMLQGHLALNTALKAHPDPQIRDTHEILIGPWDHMSYVSIRRSAAGEREFGPIAVSGPPTVAPRAFEWFDRWLVRDGEPATRRLRARYFMMGVNEWRETATWPPPHVPTRRYLRSGGHANTRFGDGVLSPEPPGEEPPDRYVYDPEDPVPTVGGRTLSPSWCSTGVQDQAEVEKREDVLVYTSPPLAEPLAIAGPVAAVLFVRSSAPDTDFTAKLVDVEPGGYCANLAEGILRARYRNGMDREAPLVPGEIALLRIELLDVAHTFATGHRIRLEIASSNFPKYDRNPNSALAPGRAGPADACVAVQHIEHDAHHPSYLDLPVVEA